MDPSNQDSRTVASEIVARRLCRASSRSSNYLPKLALGVTALAAGFIVHAALDRVRLRHEDSLVNPNSQALWQVSTADEFAPRIAKTQPEKSANQLSQVQTVVELLDAFEDVESETSLDVDPSSVDGPSTAPVAYYPGETDGTPEKTAIFLQQIHGPSPDVEVAAAKFRAGDG